MMKGIIEEVFAVMLASGHKTFWPDAKAYQKSFIEKIVPPTAEHRSSTLQDIERQMKTEIDSLTGAIIELGHKHGVPVPYNEMIFHLIKSIEGSYAYAKS